MSKELDRYVVQVNRQQRSRQKNAYEKMVLLFIDSLSVFLQKQSQQKL
jgi:hypothetical protein